LPFYHAGIGHILDGNTRLMDVPGYVSDDEDEKDSHVANVRGWGFFQYFQKGEELQDKFIEFVVRALNELGEREFGEPARWIIHTDLGKEGLHCKCPNCNDVHYFWRGWEQVEIYQYCPHCGKSLLPPEKEKAN
jgi:hypothetical protein